MLRVLPFVIQFVLLVYCFIEAIQAEPNRVRNLPKMVWLPVIALVPIAGPIAWLVAGRPLRPQARANPSSWPVRDFSGPSPAAPIAPDDNPEFLQNLKQQTEQQRRLQKWEEDLRRREQDLRRTEESDGPDDRQLR